MIESVKLNVVTPCSRPDNLPAIHEALIPFVGKIHWYIIYDMLKIDTRKGVYVPKVPWATVHATTDGESRFGNAQRNLALELIKDGWVWFCDDDNLPTMLFIDNIEEVVRKYPEVDGIVCRQIFKGGVTRLRAMPENMVVNRVDSAQVILKRRLIGNTRFELGRYEADGIFIQKVYETNLDRKWWFVGEDGVPVVYYNALR